MERKSSVSPHRPMGERKTPASRRRKTHRPTHLLLLVPCLPRTPSLVVGRLSERVSSVLSGAWQLAPYSVDVAKTNDPLMMLRAW